ncbi:winged helix-turn-helix transcriptional regulator [Hymenobacter cellulosivorans]|uniref:Helix-turn-helix transcriptional regulator n=1 Tax=Hymenobacter cellulosivorans TaxID=2932249 RepID=A0ABY4FBC0_9BACT|nr:helix-turn-helix domain-containing protein [Hymenobacter cellulosivorans]UOQ51746.1 helix-turn-helix transcriptional regulator [Hymenobacter cellulosivorans]
MSTIPKYSPVVEDSNPQLTPVASEAAAVLGEILQPVTDALYVLQGKWKLPILLALAPGTKRFGELTKALPTITDRMLSKELKELEANLLITRSVIEGVPVKVEYALTDHGISLHDVIIELQKWGLRHRKKVGLQ